MIHYHLSLSLCCNILPKKVVLLLLYILSVVTFRNQKSRRAKRWCLSLTLKPNKDKFFIESGKYTMLLHWKQKTYQYCSCTTVPWITSRVPLLPHASNLDQILLASRLFNGCRTHLRSPLLGSSLSGRKNAMSKANHSAHCQMHVLWALGNCLVKLFACTHAWSVLIITHGFLTPPEMDSLSSKIRHIS